MADEGPPPPVAALRRPVRERGVSNMEQTISLDDFLRSLETSDFSVSLFFSRKPNGLIGHLCVCGWVGGHTGICVCV